MNNFSMFLIKFLVLYFVLVRFNSELFYHELDIYCHENELDLFAQEDWDQVLSYLDHTQDYTLGINWNREDEENSDIYDQLKESNCWSE